MAYFKPGRIAGAGKSKSKMTIKQLRKHMPLKRVANRPTRNRLRAIKYLPCPVEPEQQADDDRRSMLGLPLSLPYEVESLAEMDARLEHIICKLTECVKAHEWFTGFNTWNSALNM